MEHLLNQKRVRFGAPGQGESINTKEKNRFFRQMTWDYDSDFAASVAAAAFAVYTLEEAEEEHKRKIREEFGRSQARTRLGNEDESIGSVGATRHSSGKEVKNGGETSIRKPAEQDQRVQGNAGIPSKKLSRSASVRPMISMDQRQRSNSTRRDEVEDKVDYWQKAQLRKIHKRYEKMKSEVIAWEHAKKIEAKLRMERKKNELELRKSRNLQHYQIKLERIEGVAGGAKGQLEEKRRSEEAEVKEKAKYMRLKGKKPVRCFCC